MLCGCTKQALQRERKPSDEIVIPPVIAASFCGGSIRVRRRGKRGPHCPLWRGAGDNADGVKTMEWLRVQNLVKRYGTKATEIMALNDVSFSISKGEFVAIVGPSGSGKSTLLHLMGGVDTPTSGKVFVDGTDIYALKEDALDIFRRRQIGLVYQFYNLLPVLTAEENLCLPLLLDGRTVDKAVLADMAGKLGLSGQLTHLPSQLSGGQQQKVGVGRALLPTPAIVLADEPTGNLDSKSGAEILALLRRFHDERRQTLVIVTHDESVALSADRIISLEDGRVVKDEVIRQCG